MLAGQATTEAIRQDWNAETRIYAREHCDIVEDFDNNFICSHFQE
jgi:hypothetical protein